MGGIIKGLGKVVDLAKDAGGFVLGGMKSAVGGAADLVTGRGGNNSSTTGTTVEGGVSQTFNIKLDVSGVTDASDKRTLAREIGRLIQEETARSMGGARYSGR